MLDSAATADTDDTDERATPVPLARDLREAVGGLFDVDAAAGCEPLPIGKRRYTKADDGLDPANQWTGTVYLNPPYSDPQPWVKRAATAVERGPADLVVALLPAYAASTSYFQEFVPRAAYVCAIEDRLVFHGEETQSPFASLLVVWADDTVDADAESPADAVPQTLVDVLDKWGIVWTGAEIEPRTRQLGIQEFGDESPVSEDTESAQSYRIHDSPAVGVSVGDLLTLSLDASSPFCPSDVDSNPTVRVLAGERHTDRIELLAVSPDLPWSEGEQYYLVTVTDEQVRAGIENRGWQQVPLKRITVAVDTVAPRATSYVS